LKLKTSCFKSLPTKLE